MRVLILGLGRTGTASMRVAMRELGYTDTYHMMSASIENPPDCLLWRDAFSAKFDGIGTFGREDWDQLMGHCQAVCDWPSVAFAQELINAYPEAKVILTTRNADTWHASTLKTVNWRATDHELKFLSRFSWAAGMYWPMLRKFFDTFFEGDFENKGKEIYKRHYDNVRRWVAEREAGPNGGKGASEILEFQVSEGWGPLCEFLDVPMPKDTPFPRVNDNGDFVSRSKWRNRMQAANVVFRFFCQTIIALVVIWMMMGLFGQYNF